MSGLDFNGANPFDNEESVFGLECELIISSLHSCDLCIERGNIFFPRIKQSGEKVEQFNARLKAYKRLIASNKRTNGAVAGAFLGDYDFSHTNAGWSDIISLGIYGLRNRISEYKAKYSTEENESFYTSLEEVYDAVLAFMKRASLFAREAGLEEMSESLINLTERAPVTMYEAMQTAILYYSLQMQLDNTALRTMGRVDSLFYPYYIKEEKSRGRALVADFINALDTYNAIANLPFAIGGTDEERRSLVNELSFVFIDVYREIKTQNIKLHLLFSENMPKGLVKNALEAVREGHNSIVFMNDRRVIESLVKLGINREDAVDYHVVGCYECGGRGELTCSCNAKVNLLKALEYAINNGVDMITGERVGLEVGTMPTSFDELMLEFDRQLAYLIECAREATDEYEAGYKWLHSSPILSATYTSALQRGGDLYCDYTASYNNSSINALGLASVSDSLYAIKKVIFEEKRFSLAQFRDILRSDWDGYELLRLFCKNKLSKFGTDNEDVDSIAVHVVDALKKEVNGKPNKKGGVYRLGLFSIDWRWDFGAKTAASADGRRAGEPLSQNTGASFGVEREGIGAHLMSVARLDTTATPNGTVVDIDVHSSAVRGENGLNLLMSSLQTYFELGGFAVQFNVLDTEVLLDAKRYPEKYPSLQVRLCGWNVLFSTLSDREKEEFIMRSMHV